MCKKANRTKNYIIDLVFIEGLEEDETMEQHFVEAKIMQTDVGEENVVEVEVQPSTEVQMMAEAQQKVMEMERLESKVVAKKRCTILYKVTLLENGNKIPNPNQFMWT